MIRKSVSVAIIGSTGSIGTQSLDTISRLNKNGFDFKIIGLSARNNLELKGQISAYKPLAYSFGEMLNDAEKTCKYFENPSDMIEYLKPDYTIIASSGGESLNYTIAAIKASQRVCLANKESLVLAGKLVQSQSKKSNTEIIPVDSEHSAIFQLLECEDKNNIEKIIITASGGALRDFSADRIEDASVEDVLNHPTWSMGKKITVDSASLFNKGLEIIEAHHLFGVTASEIDIMMSRNSYIHSLVKFKDGTFKIHAGKPDMRIPISYSLTYPLRMNIFEGNMYSEINSDLLTLEKVDLTKFPAPKLALDIISESISTHIAYNASNEVAVDLFLNRKIPFGKIYKIVFESVEKVEKFNPDSIKDILKLHDKIKSEIYNRF